MPTRLRVGEYIIFFKFPTDPLLLKKWLVKIKRANFKPTKHTTQSTLCLCAVNFETTCFERDPETMAALGYAGARVSLKSDAVPSIFPAVEAAFMPSIRRIQASARSESSAGGSRKRSAASAAVGSAAAAAGSASMTLSSCFPLRVVDLRGLLTESVNESR